MGNDFGTRYSQDFALLAGLGLTHHRLSIEWARIEPNEGERDQSAITHYREILLAAKEAGIHPWVCLHHFSLPTWFARLGGFLIEENYLKDGKNLNNKTMMTLLFFIGIIYN